MKILFLSLMLISFSTTAAEKIVPLEMELGYWETIAEMGESETYEKYVSE